MTLQILIIANLSSFYMMRIIRIILFFNLLFYINLIFSISFLVTSLSTTNITCKISETAALGI